MSRRFLTSVITVWVCLLAEVAVTAPVPLALGALNLPNGAATTASVGIVGAVPDDLLVVPGRRVGKIRLGATRDAVWKRIGKPTRTTRRSGGLVEDRWEYPKTRSTSDLPAYIIALFRANKAVQIEFDSPKYATANGFSVRNSLAQFRAKYTNIKTKAYLYTYFENGEPLGGHRGYYYDAVRSGIAFEFGAQDVYDARIRPASLRIHPPGKPVIADPDGKPIKASDEVPVGSFGG
jgi:hypothetical protein